MGVSDLVGAGPNLVVTSPGHMGSVQKLRRTHTDRRGLRPAERMADYRHK